MKTFIFVIICSVLLVTLHANEIRIHRMSRAKARQVVEKSPIPNLRNARKVITTDPLGQNQTWYDENVVVNAVSFGSPAETVVTVYGPVSGPTVIHEVSCDLNLLTAAPGETILDVQQPLCISNQTLAAVVLATHLHNQPFPPTSVIELCPLGSPCANPLYDYVDQVIWADTYKWRCRTQCCGPFKFYYNSANDPFHVPIKLNNQDRLVLVFKNSAEGSSAGNPGMNVYGTCNVLEGFP